MMKRKIIAPVVLTVCFVFTVAFSGCSDNQNTKNAEENSSEKSTVLTSTPISTDKVSQEKTLVKVTVKKENEKVFDKPEDIKIFTTAVETGTPMESIPEELKAPTYFVYFQYFDNETVEYFLYISPNSGWIYKNGTREAYMLSKGSIDDLNRLLFDEAEAIAKVVKDHPEFPDKAGVREDKEETGGPKGSKASVKFETKVVKNTDNAFTVTLTKTWGMTVNGKTPVSYWKYDVSLEKVILVKEDTTGEGLISIIK